ncbi:putative toxin biosynthesis protein [Xylona heveae TC161]|uniref:Putative toxin biosynthesis protein n=1 Tax=Xylona heveae (strain CBS 132557 / TC161) TaxID=1328760 RepID=A0A165JIR4_XYLHT|nr:putative toxin biosynthesis protein [Xylona heveae TC161]KZF26294.1 putative toxin biosynthesis protein [Xylona heveae TC161]
MSSSSFVVHKHEVPCQHIREYPRATSNAQEDMLHLVVKQYCPRNNLSPKPGDVTILAAHGNGFPKELFEPMWDELLHKSSDNGFNIRGIWIADVSNQGESGILNEDKIGDDTSWDDHSRDLLHMINLFRDQMPRPLIGIGHSMGACQLGRLSLLHPRLLSSLILLDPTILPPHGFPQSATIALAQASTFRRDLWPSHEDAAAAIAKNRFFQQWDARVLKLFLEHGLRELPTKLYPHDSSALGRTPVTLTTTKHQESFTYLRPQFSDSRDSSPSTRLMKHNRHGLYRPEPLYMYENLPFLRPSVLFVFGGKSVMSSPKSRAEMMELTGTGLEGSGGAKKGKVENIVLENFGHLLPMEAVESCAEISYKWINKELRQWREQEEEFGRMWYSKVKGEKSSISSEWIKVIGRLPPKSGIDIAKL